MKEFTEPDLENFLAYEKVRESGRSNMLDPRARMASGLSVDEYFFTLDNYPALKTELKARQENEK